MFNIFNSIGLICIFLLCSCSASANMRLKEYKETRPYLGTNVTIRCFYASQKDISQTIERCWEKMDMIQRELNAYSETGDLALINKSGFSGVKVRKETYELLKDCLELSSLTNAAFDITVFPLIKLWKDAAVNGRLPDKELLEITRSHVGYQNIRLQDPNIVFLSKEGVKLDLGGIASGYACDEIASILDTGGIQHFLIDTAGEIFCRGKEAGKAPWKIGIQDPVNKEKILGVIKLKDKCISTSGNYEKFYTIEGRRYSHIIDPISGYPQEEVISSTVIADTGKEADALSTALCVLGGKKGLSLIKSLKNVQAMVIEQKGDQTVIYNTITQDLTR